MSFSATIKSEPPDMGYENPASAMTVTPAIGLPNVKIEPDTLLASTSYQETQPSLELYQARLLTENVPCTNKTHDDCNHLETKDSSSQPAVIAQKRKRGSSDPLAAPPAKKLAFRANSQNRSQKKFSCKLCKMNFAEWEQVEKHLSECPKKIKTANRKETSGFKCTFCGSNSIGWKEAYKHAAMCAVSKEKECTTGPFPCKTCGSNFKVWEELVLHASNCMFSREFLCILCGKSMKGVEKLRKHTETCKKRKTQPSVPEEPRTQPTSKTAKDVSQYTCKFCRITFRRDEHLKEHSKFCSPLNSTPSFFPCTYCKLTFGKEEHLKEHTKFCTKIRVTASADSMHGGKLSAKSGLTCSYCNASFENWDDILAHTQTCEVKLCAEKARKEAEARGYKFKDSNKAGKRIIFSCHICKTKFDNWNEKLKHTPICKEEQIRKEKAKTASKQEQMRKEKLKPTSKQEQMRKEESKTASKQEQMRKEKSKTASKQELVRKEESKTASQVQVKKILFKCSYCSTMMEEEKALKDHVLACASKHGLKVAGTGQGANAETYDKKVVDNQKRTEAHQNTKAAMTSKKIVESKSQNAHDKAPAAPAQLEGHKEAFGKRAPTSKEEGKNSAELADVRVTRNSVNTKTVPTARTVSQTSQNAPSSRHPPCKSGKEETTQQKDQPFVEEEISTATVSITRAGLRKKQVTTETPSSENTDEFKTRKVKVIIKRLISPRGNEKDKKSTESVSTLETAKVSVGTEEIDKTQNAKALCSRWTSPRGKSQVSNTSGKMNPQESEGGDAIILVEPELPSSSKGKAPPPADSKKHKNQQREKKDIENEEETCMRKIDENKTTRTGRNTRKENISKSSSSEKDLVQKYDEKMTRSKTNSNPDPNATNAEKPPDSSLKTQISSDVEKMKASQIDHLQALNLMPTKTRITRSGTSLMKNENAETEESAMNEAEVESVVLKVKASRSTSKNRTRQAAVGHVHKKAIKKKKTNIKKSPSNVPEKDEEDKDAKRKIFRCGKCQKNFHMSHTLRRHRKSCLGIPKSRVIPPLKGSFSCQFCSARFQVWNEVEEHVQLCKQKNRGGIRHHSESDPASKHIRRHVNNLSSMKSLKLACKFCGKNFDAWEKVLEHVQTCTLKKGPPISSSQKRKTHKSTPTEVCAPNSFNQMGPVFPQVILREKLPSESTNPGLTLNAPMRIGKNVPSALGTDKQITIKQEIIDDGACYSSPSQQCPVSNLDTAGLLLDHSVTLNTGPPAEKVLGTDTHKYDTLSTSKETKEVSGFQIVSRRHITEEEFSNMSPGSQTVLQEKSDTGTDTGSSKKNEEKDQSSDSSSVQVKEEPKVSIGYFECLFCSSRILCKSWDDVKKHTTECMSHAK